MTVCGIKISGSLDSGIIVSLNLIELAISERELAKTSFEGCFAIGSDELSVCIHRSFKALVSLNEGSDEFFVLDELARFSDRSST